MDEATGGNQVFRQLVLTRIIEPTSKADSLRVLAEAGIDAVSYDTASQRYSRVLEPTGCWGQEWVPTWSGAPMVVLTVG